MSEEIRVPEAGGDADARSAAIAELLDQVARRNRRLEQARDELLRVREDSGELRRRVNELSGRLADTEALAARRSAQLEEANGALRAANAELSRIKGSSAFALLRRYRALVLRIAPRGSRRHRAYRALSALPRRLARRSRS